MRFGSSYGAYELDELPGCPQIAISHAAFVFNIERGRGVGTREHTLRLARIKELGYDVALCTVRSTNAAQIHILKRHEWKKVWEFRSSNSRAWIEIWMKNIDQKANAYSTFVKA